LHTSPPGDPGSTSNGSEATAGTESPRHTAHGVGSESAPDGRGSAPEASAAIDCLTARQLQVVALLADGLRYREAAACMSISPRQVQRHVANAVARTGLRNANELVAVAVSEGLVPEPGRPDA
jgi:DNA-binding CsgD family transcriptional regulator